MPGTAAAVCALALRVCNTWVIAVRSKVRDAGKKRSATRADLQVWRADTPPCRTPRAKGQDLPPACAPVRQNGLLVARERASEPMRACSPGPSSVSPAHIQPEAVALVTRVLSVQTGGSEAAAQDGSFALATL